MESGKKKRKKGGKKKKKKATGDDKPPQLRRRVRVDDSIATAFDEATGWREIQLASALHDDVAIYLCAAPSQTNASRPYITISNVWMVHITAVTDFCNLPSSLLFLLLSLQQMCGSTVAQTRGQPSTLEIRQILQTMPVLPQPDTPEGMVPEHAFMWTPTLAGDCPKDRPRELPASFTRCFEPDACVIPEVNDGSYDPDAFRLMTGGWTDGLSTNYYRSGVEWQDTYQKTLQGDKEIWLKWFGDCIRHINAALAGWCSMVIDDASLESPTGKPTAMLNRQKVHLEQLAKNLDRYHIVHNYTTKTSKEKSDCTMVNANPNCTIWFNGTRLEPNMTVTAHGCYSTAPYRRSAKLNRDLMDALLTAFNPRIGSILPAQPMPQAR